MPRARPYIDQRKSAGRSTDESIIIYTSFLIAAWHIVTAERKSILNLSACAVLVSLAWWSFANSFFFSATTLEQAWFWHKLSSIGWCGFVALTTYYFLALTGYNQRMKEWWKQALFFAPTIILIGRNLLGSTTSLAQNIVQSTSGWGWTYQNSITSVWLWVYLIYVAVYFGVAFYLLYQWAKTVKHKMKREMALSFIVLDMVTILLGVVTDVILPLTNPVIPAVASIATAIFGIGYFGGIYRYDVFNINLVISSDDILRTSNNPIFVMDEKGELLKCSHAVGGLLGYHKNELIGVDFRSLAAEKIDFSPLTTGGELMDTEAKLCCKDGVVKDVLLSASIAKDRYHSFLCIIVSCQDVSKQKRIQEELELEREKYKELAKDYQVLAYYDPLTGLPNRRHFFDALSEFEALYQREQRDFAIIFLDLDNFKHVNDIHGHEGGDELLKAAAGKLQGCLKMDEFVARLGGDEFIVMMPHTQAHDVEQKMKQIREVFQERVELNGQQYEIGVSAGCSVFSQVGDTTRLMQKADEAMYGNKKETSEKIMEIRS